MAPLQRARLIQREVVRRGGTQQRDDVGEGAVFGIAILVATGLGRREGVGMGRERVGDVGRGKHQVHGPGRDGALRHAVVLGL